MSQQPENEECIEVVTVSALATLARAEIDTQISTAKAYPRSLATFKKQVASMALLDDETAISCFYSLPRDGKQIQGPSARFAEIVACAWKNMRYGARLVSVDDKFLTAQGVAHDLESNTAVTIEVQRRITTKYGKRYSDDMITTTANAAGSIALRNAVLKVVPKAFWNPAFQEAKRVAIGDAKTLVARRAQALDYFKKLGVGEDRILPALGRKGIEDIDLDALAVLTGLRTAIKEGDTTIEEAFPFLDSAPTATRTEALAEKLKRNGPAQVAPAAPTEPKDAGELRADEDTLSRLSSIITELGMDTASVQKLCATHGAPGIVKLSENAAQTLITRLSADLEDQRRQVGAGELRI